MSERKVIKRSVAAFGAMELCYLMPNCEDCPFSIDVDCGGKLEDFVKKNGLTIEIEPED